MCDFQFYILGPFILIALINRKLIGLAFNFLILVTSLITTAVIIGQNKYPPTSIVGVTDSTGPYYTDVYIKPWTRIGPFCIGVFYGYIIKKHRSSIKIPKAINLLLWAVSLTTIGVLLFFTKYWYDGNPWTEAQAIAYGTLARPVWGLCWGYIILACATGHGGVINSILSWPALQPFAKLRYSIHSHLNTPSQ